MRRGSRSRPLQPPGNRGPRPTSMEASTWPLVGEIRWSAPWAGSVTQSDPNPERTAAPPVGAGIDDTTELDDGSMPTRVMGPVRWSSQTPSSPTATDPSSTSPAGSGMRAVSSPVCASTRSSSRLLQSPAHTAPKPVSMARQMTVPGRRIAPRASPVSGSKRPIPSPTPATHTTPAARDTQSASGSATIASSKGISWIGGNSGAGSGVGVGVGVAVGAGTLGVALGAASGTVMIVLLAGEEQPSTVRARRSAPAVPRALGGSRRDLAPRVDHGTWRPPIAGTAPARPGSGTHHGGSAQCADGARTVNTCDRHAASRPTTLRSCRSRPAAVSWTMCGHNQTTRPSAGRKPAEEHLT